MHAHFDKFRWFCYNTSNISRFLQKFHFLIEVVVHSLKTPKWPGTSFKVAVFVEFFDKNFYFVILHELAKLH